MRNLKRVLSLSLALVMMLGMMIIGASAAESTTDFVDADEIQYTEAADVLSALRVFEGDENGSFNPTQILTREQAATIICRMLLGPENAAKLSTNSSAFTDVAAGRWSAGYIAYCANLGIIAGYGDGTFGPEDQLTGVAFGKMLLVALGYNAEIEGYVGDNWATAIASDVIDAGIDVKGATLSDPLTREQAAQMALQTLSATMVKYDSKGSNITIGDITINQGASEAEAVVKASETDNYDKTAAAVGTGYQQFCEKYFPELTKVNGTSDDFGRSAAYAWKLGTQIIYNAAETPVATFTAKTSASAMAKALNGYKLVKGNDTYKVNDTYTITDDAVVFTGLVDGGDLTVALNSTVANAIARLTDNGKLVEIYADRNSEITAIVTVEYNTYTVSNVKTDEKTGNVTYTISGTTYTDYADDEVSEDTIVLNGKVSKGDVVTTVSAGSKLYVYPTTVIQGVQTATKTANNVQTITVGGSNYVVGASSDPACSFVNGNAVANYYLDQYGYVVYTDSTATASTDYAYLVNAYGSVKTTIDGTTPTVQGRFVLADGTVAVYDIALSKNNSNVYWIKNIGSADNALTLTSDGISTSVNDCLDAKVFGYTLEDGVITLEALNSAMSANAVVTASCSNSAYIVKGDTSVVAAEGTVLLTSATKYVVYDDNTKTAAVYTSNAGLGSTTLDSFVGVAKCNAAGTLATASVIFDTVTNGITAVSGNYAYINEKNFTTVGSGSSVKYVYTGVLADGSEVELTAKGTALTTSDNGSLYKYTDEMIVSSADKIAYSAENTFTGNETVTWGSMIINGDMMNFSGGSVYYDISNAEIIYINKNLDEVNDNAGYVVRSIANGVTTIKTIYVVAD